MPSVRIPRFAIACLVLVLSAAAAQAAGDGLSVAPIRVDIATGARAEVLTVTNHGDVPGDVQVRTLAWRQSGDEDIHEPTDDITVSPPRFALAAGAQQTVRVYRRIDAPPSERTYRIVVDRIPTVAAAPGTVRLPIRLVVPLFVAGARDGAVDLAWHAALRADAIALRIDNRGDRHVRISRLGVVPADGAAPPVATQLVYVLPGAQRNVVLARPDWLAAGTRTVRMVGDSDAGAIDARVDLVDAR